jgi:hypothetical protein
MRRRYVFLLVGLLLVGAACADSGISGEGDASAADRTCLAGDPDCQDNPGGGTGDPTGPPSGGVSVAGVVGTNIDGGFAIEGFYYSDGTRVIICQDLAESFPAQCGEPFIPFDNSAGADLGVLDSEQGITWSPGPIMVIGRVVDGVFVADG